MTAVVGSFLQAFNYLILVYFIVLNITYLAMSLVAFRALQKYARRLDSIDVTDLITSAGAPPVTLLAPAYNEEATCVESVKSLRMVEYPDYEILLVNDGSTDGTLPRLKEAFDLEPAPRVPTAELPTARVRGVYRSRKEPDLWVIDKENGGKADALNAGLNFCRTPFFCAMDSDTLLEPQALTRVVRPFLEDESTVAAGGIIRIVNGSIVKGGMVEDVRLPRKLVPRFQILEYLRAFLAGRMGWDALDSMLIISGAFGLFRRSAVVEAGGYWTRTVGEDMELVVRLHRRAREKGGPYRVAFVPDPVAWTEAPETLRVLGRQRDRWQRGLIQALTRHRKMLFHPRYGRIGLFAFPYFYILEMFGPLIELGGYLSFVAALFLGAVSTPFLVAFLMVAFFLGITLSVAAVGLEELSFRRYHRWSDLVRLFLLAVVENFGYRQLSQYWRVKGTFTAMLGRQSWGVMERKGFGR